MTGSTVRRIDDSGQSTAEGRPAALNWPELSSALDQNGWAAIPGLLDEAQCAALRARYGRPEGFRSRVVMERHGYGRGEYRYFDYPLPEPVAGLRAALYPPLATIANRWREALGQEASFPATHEEYLQRCHDRGQWRPTPLLLRYGVGDYNRLHQDLYGDEVFPLQLACLLSQPGADFEGGDFVLTEQRPRMQSRAEVVPLSRGDAVIFAVAQRPQRGTRGWHRVTMRHGVATVRSGSRYTLGLVFHDAR